MPIELNAVTLGLFLLAVLTATGAGGMIGRRIRGWRERRTARAAIGKIGAAGSATATTDASTRAAPPVVAAPPATGAPPAARTGPAPPVLVTMDRRSAGARASGGPGRSRPARPHRRRRAVALAAMGGTVAVAGLVVVLAGMTPRPDGAVLEATGAPDPGATAMTVAPTGSEPAGSAGQSPSAPGSASPGSAILPGSSPDPGLGGPTTTAGATVPPGGPTATPRRGSTPTPTPPGATPRPTPPPTPSPTAAPTPTPPPTPSPTLDLPPLDFTWDPPVGLEVTFHNTTTGPGTWSWDLGDGGTSTRRNPIHTYAAAGTYTVRLTAVRSGTTDSVTHAVTVP